MGKKKNLKEGAILYSALVILFASLMLFTALISLNLTLNKGLEKYYNLTADRRIVENYIYNLYVNNQINNDSRVTLIEDYIEYRTENETIYFKIVEKDDYLIIKEVVLNDRL